MQYSSIFWWTILWVVSWGVIGGVVTRKVFLRKDLDTSNATLGGSVIGAAFGPIGLIREIKNNASFISVVGRKRTTVGTFLVFSGIWGHRPLEISSRCLYFDYVSTEIT